ncbi:unnamed protein product [Schistosoma margrebowiei]|uniref:Uncharacterized protein n=1 Tax=Schistosoma margrebowiei TaxID=48269 RepID=A0A183MK64_9TREM|nr:unnamed protein product [Schistosoma margrebowiei]
MKITSVVAASLCISRPQHTQRKKQDLQIQHGEHQLNHFDGETLEEVKPLTYQGSIIDEQGESDVDVKARIDKLRAAFLQLNNMCNSKQLSTNIKITIFNMNVKTVSSTVWI